jgi:hypothetical protein
MLSEGSESAPAHVCGGESESVNAKDWNGCHASCQGMCLCWGSVRWGLPRVAGRGTRCQDDRTAQGCLHTGRRPAKGGESPLATQTWGFGRATLPVGPPRSDGRGDRIGVGPAPSDQDPAGSSGSPLRIGVCSGETAEGKGDDGEGNWMELKCCLAGQPHTQRCQLALIEPGVVLRPWAGVVDFPRRSFLLRSWLASREGCTVCLIHYVRGGSICPSKGSPIGGRTI